MTVFHVPPDAGGGVLNNGDLMAVVGSVDVVSGAPTLVAGGAANGVTVNSGGFLGVEYGIATGTTVNAGGRMGVSARIYFGGPYPGAIITTATARDTVVNSGAYLATSFDQILAQETTLYNTMINGGTVWMTGTGIDTTVNAGGTLDVLFGTASSTTLNDGTVTLYRLAKASDVTVNGGTLMLGDASLEIAGGIASHVTVNNGGTMVAFDGGTAIDTTVNNNGTVIASGGGLSATTVNGGGLLTMFGGVASSTTVVGGALMSMSGGVASSTTVSGGGLFNIFNGVASSSLVLGGGKVNVSGGAANDTTVNNGGEQHVWAGGAANDTSVNGGVEIVAGAANSTTVNDGGEQTVSSGGSASLTTVNGGAKQEVLSDAVVSGTAVNGGGTQDVLRGGIADDTKVNGGVENIAGVAHRTTVSTDGIDNVNGGGTATGTTVNGGVENVNAGGSASGTTVNAGVQNVSAGGVASRATVSVGGEQFVWNGGTASDTTVRGSTESGRAVEKVAGVANRATVNSGGEEQVLSGGVVSGTTVNNGGYQRVLAGGVASRTTIYGGGSGGVQGLARDTTVNGGIEDVGSGGVATAATVNGGGTLNVNDGGVAAGATANNGGSLVVWNGGTASGTSVNDGGTEHVLYGGAAVSFTGAGRARLILDPNASLSGVLAAGASANNLLELAPGVGVGTLNSFGPDFASFATLMVDAGASWKIPVSSTFSLATALTNNGTMLVDGPGTGVPDLGVSAISNNGVLTVSNGVLTSTGPVAGTGTLAVGHSGELVLTNAVDNHQTFQFTDATGTLDISGVSNFSGGTIEAYQTLAPGTFNPATIDHLVLPGAPGEYKFDVSFPSGNKEPIITTVFRQTSASGAPISFNLTGIALATFADPIDNRVTGLFGDNIYSEMAELAHEVYGPLPTLDHGAEALAYEVGGNYPYARGVGDKAEARGWHEVSALELGIPQADLGASNLHYSFEHGFYAAIDPALPVLPTAEDNALVLTGVVNDKRTLAVVFRGTDQYADFSDYFHFPTQAYAKYKPLVAALKSYAQSNNIQQVLVSGHSMGGGLAQIFAEDLGSVFSGDIQTFTFGSPGAELSPAGARQVNFVHTDDLVPKLGALTSSPVEKAVLVAAASLVNPSVGRALEIVLATIGPKSLSGATVRLNSDISGWPFSLTEHDMGIEYAGINPVRPGYIGDIVKLIYYAKDQDLPHPFALSSLGQAIAANTVYSGRMPQIAIGNGTWLGGIMHTITGDQYVLGDRYEADVIQWGGAPDPSAPRIVDGGPGGGATDALVVGLRFTASLISSGDYADLYLKSAFLPEPILQPKLAAHLYRIAKVIDVGFFNRSTLVVTPIAGSIPRAPFATTAQSPTSVDPSQLVLHVDGSPTTVQQATTGAQVLLADGSADVAYAGPGVTEVDGSLPRLVVLYGSDTTLVHMTGDASVIVSDGEIGSAPVTIDTGGAAGLVYGGPSDETLIGYLAGASFDGGDGLDTLDYRDLAAPIVLDLAAGTATDNVSPGDSFDNVERFLAPSVGGSTLELTSGGTISSVSGLGSNFVNFGTISIDPGAAWSLDGFNIVGANTSILINQDASLNVSGSLVGAADYSLMGPNATLQINTPVGSGQTFNFDIDAPETLILGTPESGCANPITNLGNFDRIELAGLSIAAASLTSPGTITVTQSSGPAYMLTDVNFGADSSQILVTGHDAVTGNDFLQVACFASGTHIGTEFGEVAVEDLREGDSVRTLLDGTAAPIIWIGHRRVDCEHHPRPEQVWPVRIRAGAFGPDQPFRDLFLSPDHAVYVDDVLIPVKYLINRTTIAQVPVDEVTYYHLELPDHDVMRAEGLLVESYLDTGDRSNFADGGGAMRLFPDFGTRSLDPATVWEAKGRAPLVVRGPELEAARHLVSALAASEVGMMAVA